MTIRYRLFVLTALFAVAVGFPAVADNATSGWQPVKQLLAKADVSAGEKQAHVCSSCHTFDKGGAKKMGPNLWGIVNSGIAQSSGYAYSDALKAKAGQKWTYDALDRYLFNPKDFAPGDKMPFGGIRNAQDRANLIAWMRTQTDKPAPLPKK